MLVNLNLLILFLGIIFLRYNIITMIMLADLVIFNIIILILFSNYFIFSFYFYSFIFVLIGVAAIETAILLGISVSLYKLTNEFNIEFSNIKNFNNIRFI